MLLTESFQSQAFLYLIWEVTVLSVHVLYTILHIVVHDAVEVFVYSVLHRQSTKKIINRMTFYHQFS